MLCVTSLLPSSDLLGQPGVRVELLSQTWRLNTDSSHSAMRSPFRAPAEGYVAIQMKASSPLAHSVPLGQELFQVPFQVVVALGGETLAGGGVHAVLEEQEFFVKVIEGRATAAFVSGEGRVELGLHVRIVEGLACVAAVGKGAGDADRAEGVEAVGVLDALTFERTHRRGDAGAFEREGGDDLADVVDRRLRDMQRFEPSAGGAGAGVMIAAGEFPIGDVVEEGGKFDEEEVGLLLAGERERGAANAEGVVPVVAGSFAGEEPSDVVAGLL